MLDLHDEMQSIFKLLKSINIEYALCGGMAMAVWGKARATVDIDILILTESAGAASEKLADIGYKFESAPMSFAAGVVQIRRLTKIDPASRDHLSLDMLLVTPQLVDIWREREIVQWEGGELVVIPPAGLIQLKQLRNSAQDLADIEALRA